jgi:hypothetical protein
MSLSTISEQSACVRRSGRPKGIPKPETKRMLDAWDLITKSHTGLNRTALLRMAADEIFGVRLNLNVRKKDIERLKRALQRHGRI